MKFLFRLFLLCSCCVPLCSAAQLCSGSLGDPIVNINFGAGANPGAPLTSATTSYLYQSGDCPNDGFYTVRNSTTACFSNTWHSVTRDHTGNTNGYFMLINASLQPGAFYLDTVRNLCPNTTYEFAAWIMNVILPSACNGASSQPNITFTIEKTDGTVLQVYNANDIGVRPTPVWNQFGFFFSTPAGVSAVVLRMRNNAPGGCGNDLALDDITFRQCGPLLATTISGSPSNGVNFCSGTAASYTFTCTASAGFNNPVYQWQSGTDGISYNDIPGATASTYTAAFSAAALPGIFYFRCSVAEAGNIASPACRVSSGPVTVTVNAQPTVSVSANSPVCSGQTITLFSGGGVTYNWSGPNNFNATTATAFVPNAMVINAGRYYVTVENAGGCRKIDSVDVIVNATPVAAVSFSDSTVCAGQPVQLNATGGGTYSWFPSAGLSSNSVADPIAVPADSTLYGVSVSNSAGCADTAFSKINVVKRPMVSAGPDKVIIAGTPIVLNGSVTGAVSFSWSPATFINDPNLLQPVVAPPVETEYTLSATAARGCGTASDAVTVKVYDDIYIPNSFSPNNDGKNDRWNIVVPGADNYDVAVYDRYGNAVFRNKNAAGWDGTYKSDRLPAGVYVYVVNTGGAYGIRKGTLTLVR